MDEARARTDNIIIIISWNLLRREKRLVKVFETGGLNSRLRYIKFTISDLLTEARLKDYNLADILAIGEYLQSLGYEYAPIKVGGESVRGFKIELDNKILRERCGTSMRIVERKPANDDRKPLPPSIIMDTIQDKLHVDLPGRRTVKATRRKGARVQNQNRRSAIIGTNYT